MLCFAWEPIDRFLSFTRSVVKRIRWADTAKLELRTDESFGYGLDDPGIWRVYVGRPARVLHAANACGKCGHVDARDEFLMGE